MKVLFALKQGVLLSLVKVLVNLLLIGVLDKADILFELSSYIN